MGEHKLAFSSNTHSPRVAALSKTPSTHSNLPALVAAPPQASWPSWDALSRHELESCESVVVSSVVSPSTDIASLASRLRELFEISNFVAAKAKINASSASLAPAASVAVAVRAAHCSQRFWYLDHICHTCSTETSKCVLWPFLCVESTSSALDATSRSCDKTSSSRDARSRAGSFC